MSWAFTHRQNPMLDTWADKPDYSMDGTWADMGGKQTMEEPIAWPSTQPTTYTKDEWIEITMGLLGTLADYVPNHLEHGTKLVKLIIKLQNARFVEDGH